MQASFKKLFLNFYYQLNITQTAVVAAICGVFVVALFTSSRNIIIINLYVME